MFKQRIFSTLLLMSVLPLSQTVVADDSLQNTIDNPQRTESNQQRDVFRNPSATLMFFGVSSGYAGGRNLARSWLVH